jgi:hypothetical protein
MASPTASWQPNLARRQSWNREDLKREMMLVSELGREQQGGEGMGFTEVEKKGERGDI